MYGKINPHLITQYVSSITSFLFPYISRYKKKQIPLKNCG